MPSYKLFQRYGVEMEYMIVDAETLDVRPIADKLVHSISSARKNEVKHGEMRWSNELVLHVIEIKTGGPVRSLEGLDVLFQDEVRYLNQMLAEHNCRLLPTGMHPWMDPDRETHLWPHGNKDIYRTFDRIFNCKGHGWSNLQSTHINLPFIGDEEFHKLHTAIRLILPILPALAASSPFIDGSPGAHLDMRLHSYRSNCARVPMITGKVVPEYVQSRAEYEEKILGQIYSDMAVHDPEGILKDEWVNARGAIARFGRGTIEIRVLDIQETPKADMAIIQFIVQILKSLASGQLSEASLQKDVPLEDLACVFDSCVTHAEQGQIDSTPVLRALGIFSANSLTAREVLKHLFESCCPTDASWAATMSQMLSAGTLATRIRNRAGKSPSKLVLKEIYRELAVCLEEGRLFL